MSCWVRGAGVQEHSGTEAADHFLHAAVMVLLVMTQDHQLERRDAPAAKPLRG